MRGFRPAAALAVLTAAALLTACTSGPDPLVTAPADTTPATPAPSAEPLLSAPPTTPPATISPSARPSRRPSARPKARAKVSGSGSPFRGVRLYVDPGNEAALAAKQLASSDPRTAALVRKIAQQPTAHWVGDWVPTGQLRERVATHARSAKSRGALPVFVAYNIPQRDCGSFSAGGAGDAGAYRAWIDALADGLTGKAAVILEPDALHVMDCLSAEQKERRYALLRYAVQKLSSRPGVAVYLDAGGWVEPAEIARRLERAGVRGARGFAVNVSGFETTADMTAYGTKVSRQLGGKTFVIDTSRNGSGPTTGELSWCNPRGRSLGERPLTTPPSPLVDALLWIKGPGGSDGECNRGDPPAGTYWPEYAAGLASRAGW